MATFTFSETVTLEASHCPSCNFLFAIPEKMRERLRASHETFYCPNGHSNYYPQESEAEKLRRELKRKEQELANTAIEKIKLQNEINEKDRQLKRVHKGVCPCCNRSFVNLQRHMKTKHPESIKK